MKKLDENRESIPKDQLKNKSSWTDSVLGRLRTDDWDSYYENLPTKLSNTLYENKGIPSSLKKTYQIYCNILGPFHILPDFLFLGPGACGTTSMLELYLRSNNDILPSKVNEIQYFNKKHTNSINWYKILFPSKFRKNLRKLSGKKTITGEASGNYILNPNSPARIKKIIPNVKLIVMLRNPVNRTLSHYKRRIRNKKEKRSLEDSIKYELNNFEDEFKKYIENENSISVYPQTSYLARSRYFEHIEIWFKHFSRDQFLFINSDEYFKNPLQEYNRILEFLELRKHNPAITGKRGISPPGLYDNIPIKSETIDFLKNYFSPWNEKLFNLIKTRYDWNK